MNCIRCGQPILAEDRGAIFCRACAVDPRRGIEIEQAGANWYDDDPAEERQRQYAKAAKHWGDKRKQGWKPPAVPDDVEERDFLLADLALLQRNNRAMVEAARERRRNSAH